MMHIQRVPPPDNCAFRQALYEGAIFLLEPTPASQRLVESVLARIEAELGAGPVREAQFRLSDEEFFRRIGRLRKVLFLESRGHAAVRELLAGHGFEPGRTAFDPIRLRAIPHRGYENPRAAPVYDAHRDTWYAHPQCLVTWWVPLHDVAEEETFVFFPDAFQQAVANGSAAFDYDRWVRDGWDLKIGWQDREASRRATYPALAVPLEPGQQLGFSARAGEMLLFAGAHLHQTLPNNTGRTRFSIDFRTVYLDDHAHGVGAPNADNRSTGSALPDYVQPVEVQP